MNTVTTRELRKNLTSALLRVERGETLRITRNRRTVARLVPASEPPVAPPPPEPWPDLESRALKLIARPGRPPISASQLVIDNRGDW